MSDSPETMSVEQADTVILEALKILPSDIESGLAQPVIKALAVLKAEQTSKYMQHRSAIRKANSDVRLGLLDSMVNNETGGDRSEESAGGVEQLIDMVQAMGELFISTDDEPYITFPNDGHAETWALESRTFRELVSNQYFERFGRAPRAQQLNDALTTLSGSARYARSAHGIEEVFLRVAKKESDYLLDMTDANWRVIKLSPNGFEILNESPVKFRRPKGAMPLFEPDSSGEKSDLLKLVNVQPDDVPILVAVMCEMLRPETAYPVIEIAGEQGSGKSTTQKNIRRLIDPKDVALRAQPKTVEDVFISARNNHIVSYNNLSRLPADLQDAMCCLSTGGGYAARRLYSNDEESTYDAKRPISINGIGALATAPDLISRLNRIECPVISGRVSDSKLDERLEEHGPKALGFLLNTFCKALNLLPSVKIDNPPRMMDFAQLGEAVAQAMDYAPGEFMARYTESLNAAAEQSIEGVPIIESLISHVKESGSVNDTVGGLFTTLSRQRIAGVAWPNSARAFGEEVRRHEPALRMMGFTISRPTRSGRGRRIEVSFSRKEKSCSKQRAQSTQRTETASDGAEKADSNARCALSAREIEINNSLRGIENSELAEVRHSSEAQFGEEVGFI